jgi:hypothetical protein
VGDPESVKKERWLAKGVIAGLATNVVWTIILTALSHAHVKWISPGIDLGATLEGFFVYQELLIFGGGLLLVIMAFGILTDDIPDYVRSKRDRDRYRKTTPGYELLKIILLRIGYSLAWLLAAETCVFIAGTIYNFISGHPLLTPFINT